MSTFEGKTAVITGGGTGVGAAIALALAQAKAEHSPDWPQARQAGSGRCNSSQVGHAGNMPLDRSRD